MSEIKLASTQKYLEKIKELEALRMKFQEVAAEHFDLDISITAKSRAQKSTKALGTESCGGSCDSCWTCGDSCPSWC